MPLNPSIRCPQCQNTGLDAHLISSHHGGQDVSGFTCRACHFTWKAFATPQFSSPDYTAAYADAPDLVDEELALIILAEQLKEQDTDALLGHGRPVDGYDQRIFKLRKAAWLDRAARRIELGYFLGSATDAEVDHASTQAAHSAFHLLSVDLRNGQDHVAGEIGPGSPEWDIAGGSRAYVRSEYAAWRQAEQDDADRSQVFPHRGPDGDLYDGDGRAL